MPQICPSILADDSETFKIQMEKIAGFAPRVQIDLTDGQFAKHETVDLASIWWPVGIQADIHLMYGDPTLAVEFLIDHSPNLVIVHAEADADFKQLAKLCHRANIKFGIAILPQTLVEDCLPMLEQADHAMIFSGSLGQFGGHADLNLLAKVDAIKRHLPEIEIGWDGGINDQNVAALAAGGVDVLNVGGFIQNSPDPHKSFEALQRIADETGTT